ncbi:MAG: ATP-binding cassette domain-containing protein [Dictyoglomus sp.]|jgi:ABC-type nitrate/sulfonate/bicarbonate transport system ATPase subunit|uniref:ATP-binding cassette domain-containing protein n=1 Tax=Dictyoglomus sp. TaxID=28205 RepID=UPI003D11B17D
MVFLRVNNIKKSFDEKKVLDGVFMEVYKGERVIIRGPNGVGKTTLLKIIAGIILPDEGSIDFLVKPQISFQFQNVVFFPWLSMMENLELFVRDKEILKNLIEYFSLRDFFHLYPSEISGGYQQIFSFVRALSIPHNLLILDEPFKSLDPERKKRVKEVLKDHLKDRKITLLMVSHQEEEEREIADRIFNLA